MTVLRWIQLLAVLSILLPMPGANAAPPPAEKVPTFQLRARVISAGGKEPAANQAFRFRLGAQFMDVKANGWSGWMKYDRAQAIATLNKFSPYAKGFPVLSGLAVDGVVDPTNVEIELKLDETGETVKTSAELFGSVYLTQGYKRSAEFHWTGVLRQVSYWHVIQDPSGTRQV